MENSYILRNPSENEIINVIDQNCSDLLKKNLDYLDKDDFLKNNPNSEFSVKNDVSKFFTGLNLPMWNSFWGANFTEQEVKEKVSTLISQAKRKNIPFMWWVGALSKPHNLGDYLVKAGLIKHESPGMYLNLTEIDETKYQEALDQSKIKIERVSNPKEEEQWIDIGSTAFGMDEVKDEGGPIWRVCFKFCDSYLATIEGKPVGVSLVLYGSGVAGIYCVGVSSEYRNRGIGKAITMAPLLQAKKKGYEISVLTASQLGFNVYSRIGFKECCKKRMYIYAPDNQKEEK